MDLDAEFMANSTFGLVTPYLARVVETLVRVCVRVRAITCQSVGPRGGGG